MASTYGPTWRPVALAKITLEGLAVWVATSLL